jgi:hypothetical protein
VEHFGGFTAREATGGWSDGRQTITEPVTVYDVAMEGNAADMEHMRCLARQVGQEMEQDCVYLAFNPAVNIEFIVPEPLEKAA